MAISGNSLERKWECQKDRAFVLGSSEQCLVDFLWSGFHSARSEGRGSPSPQQASSSRHYHLCAFTRGTMIARFTTPGDGSTAKK